MMVKLTTQSILHGGLPKFSPKGVLMGNISGPLFNMICALLSTLSGRILALAGRRRQQMFAEHDTVLCHYQ